MYLYCDSIIKIYSRGSERGGIIINHRKTWELERASNLEDDCIHMCLRKYWHCHSVHCCIEFWNEGQRIMQKWCGHYFYYSASSINKNVKEGYMYIEKGFMCQGYSHLFSWGVVTAPCSPNDGELERSFPQETIKQYVIWLQRLASYELQAKSTLLPVLLSLISGGWFSNDSGRKKLTKRIVFYDMKAI